jgi:hypothetical protein
MAPFGQHASHTLEAFGQVGGIADGGVGGSWIGHGVAAGKGRRLAGKCRGTDVDAGRWSIFARVAQAARAWGR